MRSFLPCDDALLIGCVPVGIVSVVVPLASRARFSGETNDPHDLAQPKSIASS